MPRASKSFAHELALVAYRRAGEAGDQKATGAALAGAAAVLRSSLRLRQTLAHPGVAQAKRLELLGRLVELTPTARAVVVALLGRRLLGALGAVARGYATIADARAASVTAKVETAGALAAADEKRLAAALAEALGRPVTLSVRVNPRLLGGLRITAGELVVDGSVAGAFDRLAASLGAN